MTHKPSSPTDQMEMEKGVVGSHKLDGEGSTSTSDTQAVGSHMSDGDGPSGPIGSMEMENGPTNTHDM